MKYDFKVGDLVKFKAKFLQSAGWYTDVPRDGKVLDVRPLNGDDSCYLLVAWSDGCTNTVAACNVMAKGKPDYSGR